MTRTQSGLDKLLAYHRETAALEQIGGLLAWDQETKMPKGAAEQRAEWSGILEGTIQVRTTSVEFSDLLDEAADDSLDEFGGACVRELRRVFERAVKQPDGLPEAIARLSSLAIVAWQAARESEQANQFQEMLSELVDLKREEAAALSDNGNRYQALLDIYEEGATTDWLDGLFDRLRPGLLGLRQRLLDSNRKFRPLSGRFPEEAQLELARHVASTFGFDWSRGRLDTSVHPFTSGAGNDVRMTTKVSESDPLPCLYATIHETGHACYEQNVRQEYLLSPLGKGASFGVHESQSRICENQIGRSRAFCSWLFELMNDRFGDMGVEDAEALFAAVNAVKSDFIRTEADEVHYNLHIMLRYSLERDLIDGKLEVKDLEEAWNDRFLNDFGFPVDRPSNGYLQDIHWSAGMFGYFPTYTIGNIYAASLHNQMQARIPEFEQELASGNLEPACQWLKSEIQQYGKLKIPKKLIEDAARSSVSESPMLDYLEAKFSELYDL